MEAREHKRRKSQNGHPSGRQTRHSNKRPRRDDSMEGPALPSVHVIDLTADSDEDIVDAAIDKKPAAGYDTCFGLVSTSLNVNVVPTNPNGMSRLKRPRPYPLPSPSTWISSLFELSLQVGQ